MNQMRCLTVSPAPHVLEPHANKADIPRFTNSIRIPQTWPHEFGVMPLCKTGNDPPMALLQHRPYGKGTYLVLVIFMSPSPLLPSI